MEKKEILGLTGSVTLCLGVFTPVLLVPELGHINYFIAGKGDATIIIGLGLVSLLLSFKKKYKALWYTGLGSFGVILFTFMSIRSSLSGTSPGIVQTSLSWGWGVLMLGALTLTASAAIKSR